MAKVRIEPGGKIIIALVVLGAALFLFFELKPSAQPGQETAKATQSTATQSGELLQPSKAVETQPPAKVQPQQSRSLAATPPVISKEPIRIYFAFNRAGINKNVYCIFDRIQEIVRQKGANGLKIVVEGNADSIGPSWYNEQLSKARAARVADSLAKRLGIPRQNISLVANGSSHPIASNRTRAGRADNRRTDVIIYP